MAVGSVELEHLMSRTQTAMERAAQEAAKRAQQAAQAQQAQQAAAQGAQQQGTQGASPQCRQPVDAATQSGARQAAVGNEILRRASVGSGGSQEAQSAPRPQRGLSPQSSSQPAAPREHGSGGSGGTDASGAPARALSRGARGDEVKHLQRTLNERGARLAEDGIFGPKTQAAVRAFQRQQGMRPDGVANARTREALKTSTAGAQRGTGAERVGSGQPVGDTSTVRGAAQFLLHSPNVSFWSGLSTGSDRKNLERLARGEKSFVNATGQHVQVNPRLMQALVEMAKKGPIQINALTGGQHSRGSQHYVGNAVDLSVRVGNARQIERIANQFGGRRNFETTHIHLSF